MNVLVIDDTFIAIKALINGLELRQKLNDWDFYYTKKTNYKEIVEELKHSDFIPDIVILDLMIPARAGSDSNEPNGLKILEQIRNGKFTQIFQDIKIIIVSAKDDFKDVEKSHGKYRIEIIPKPADLNKLFKKLEAFKERSLS